MTLFLESGAAAGGSNLSFIIMMVALIAVFYFFMIRPENKRKKEAEAMRNALKVGDNITTDHIMPAGAKILPLRSNIPKISEYCFAVCDEGFHDRALQLGQSIIVGGSREHAALAPLYLGIKAVIVKSFARIHMANLINAGIIPMTFADEADYDRIDQMDELSIHSVIGQIQNGDTVTVTNVTKGFDFLVNVALSPRQKDMLIAGGLLNYTKNNA